MGKKAKGTSEIRISFPRVQMLCGIPFMFGASKIIVEAQVREGDALREGR